MRFRVPEWAAVLFFFLMCLLVVGYALRCAYAFTCARHAQSDGREHDVYIKEEWSGGKKTEVMMGHFGVSLFSFSPSGWGRKEERSGFGEIYVTVFSDRCECCKTCEDRIRKTNFRLHA